jgi:hypothetical protein
MAKATDQQSRSSRVRSRPDVLAVPNRRPGAAQALALQRLAGNRVTSRVLARWIKHPDPDQKGVMVPDVVAADIVRFNPPKNA